MIIMHPNATVIPETVTIDIAKLVATSPLAGKGTFGPLPPHVRELIEQTVQEQRLAKQQGDLLPTNYIISGPGSRTSRSIVSSSQNTRRPQPLPQSPDGSGGPGQGNP